jgi:hypothetical protein
MTTATDHLHDIAQYTHNLRDGLPTDWAQQVYDYLSKHFPEELEENQAVSAHAVQVVCFHLGFEREDD